MLTVIAHNIRSLYNVGALFRLCDGVGVDKLYLTGYTGAPFDDIMHQRQRRQVAKTALEGLDSTPWEFYEDPTEVIEQLRSKNVQIVSLEITPTSVAYDSVNFHNNICLVLGHETDGVDQQLLNQSDLIIQLPMYGRGKSLNVISSASVALYQIRQKMKATS